MSEALAHSLALLREIKMQLQPVPDAGDIGKAYGSIRRGKQTCPNVIRSIVEYQEDVDAFEHQLTEIFERARKMH